MEIQVLELKKFQKDIREHRSVIEPEINNENDSEHSSVYDWMKFFRGKTRKEFGHMSQKDKYIGRLVRH